MSIATRDANDLLLEQGQVYELRILHTRQGTVSGYFDDFDKLLQAAAQWNGKAPGVYVTLNPVNPSLLARSANQVKGYAKHTTNDADIINRRWFPIDCDPVRPSGISATDAEHDAALARAKNIGEWLSEQGWPKPIWADSGNGGHLLYRIDLPNDADSGALMRRCLEALDLRFSESDVTVDVKNYNAARIWKLYGTTAAKGDSTAERPHRASSVLEVPAELEVVDVTLLKRLADMAPRPEAKGPRGDFELERWVAERNLSVARTGPWQGGTKWILNPCPWNSDHIDDSAYIVQFASRAIAAGCHHNSCAGKDWRALRDLLDPRTGPKHEPSVPAGNGASPEPVPDDDIRETDLGNAMRLVHRHGHNLRHCWQWGKWLHWQSRRWAEDDTAQVYRLAKETVRSIYAEAAEAVTKAHAVRSESRSRIEAMVSLARSEPGIPVRPADLDAGPWLLNVQNGIIDLRTGELRPHRREDLITKLAPIRFDPDAQAPVFMEFLDRIMGRNQALVTYLQRTLGRALTGDVSEHRLEMWHGVGANGKSTLMNAVLAVTGDYGSMAAPGLLLGRPGDRHPTEVADLRGARFVASVEVGENRMLSEELVKRLTGGDRLKARFMRQDLWEFEPTHKLFVACNRKPSIRGSDHAIWRRVKLVPFAVVIPDAEQDKKLGMKLKAERSGILNWLIQGCLDWQRDGLTEPDEVKAATADYRTEQDTIGTFIEDCCLLGERKGATAAELYAAYRKWCEETHEEEQLSKKAFGLHLADRGFTRGRTGQERWWFGVGLMTRVTLDLDTDDAS